MYFTARTFAILVGIFSAHNAYADDKLACVMQDLRGNKFEYGFVKASNLTSSEILFKRNGVVVSHATPPTWRVGWNDLNFWLIPDDTPDYYITIGKLRSLGPTSDFRGAEAVLYRNVDGQRRFVSKGVCGTKYGTWKVSIPIESPMPSVQAQQPQPTYVAPSTPLSQASTPSDAASVFMEGAGLPHQ